MIFTAIFLKSGGLNATLFLIFFILHSCILGLCYRFSVWSVEPRFELGTATVSEDAGIDPKTVVTLALAVSQTL